MEEVIFTPLDLPELHFERNSLLYWYDRNKERGYEEYVASIGYPWNVLWLRDEDRALDWRSDLEHVFPDFHRTMAATPFEVFRKVYILEQVIDVQAHRDVSREDQTGLGPSTYRAMLINDHPESFYYLRGEKAPDDEQVKRDEPKLFPTFPRPRMWFAHNNYNSRHGALLPPEGARKLIFCIWGSVDPARHIDLVQRSRALYSQWEIRR